MRRHGVSLKQSLSIICAGIMALSGLVGCYDNKNNEQTPEYQLNNFTAGPEIADRICAKVAPGKFEVNLPKPGDWLLTGRAPQATFGIVVRVKDETLLTLTFPAHDLIVEAALSQGIAHEPGMRPAQKKPIAEEDYRFPQIWPTHWATLFAWPATGGIGDWQEIFTADADDVPILLAITRDDGQLDVLDCPALTPTPTVLPSPTPTGTPTKQLTRVPTAIPTTVPTAIPAMTPTAIPTITPAPTPTPTVLPSPTPTGTPTKQPTTVPTAIPTATPTMTPAPTQSSQFTDNGDGTVTDTDTGKLWTKAPTSSQYSWDAARTYCSTLSLAGGMNWRLPVPSELKEELYDAGITCSSPSPFIGVTCIHARYWSTDTDEPPAYTGLQPGYAWYVRFVDGYVGSIDEGPGYFVRCVHD